MASTATSLILQPSIFRIQLHAMLGPRSFHTVTLHICARLPNDNSKLFNASLNQLHIQWFWLEHEERLLVYPLFIRPFRECHVKGEYHLCED
jgi:hypothetical protein